jgi:hypothetical protein
MRWVLHASSNSTLNYQAYFSKVRIPDEHYFQSLAKVSPQCHDIVEVQTHRLVWSYRRRKKKDQDGRPTGELEEEHENSNTPTEHGADAGAGMGAGAGVGAETHRHSADLTDSTAPQKCLMPNKKHCGNSPIALGMKHWPTINKWAIKEVLYSGRSRRYCIVGGQGGTV